ncbi:MAG: phage portal protein [Minisyncoccota bacterium]
MSDDLFGSDEPETTGKDLVTRVSTDLITKDHSAPMSLAEFAGWLENNIGGTIAEALEQAAFMLCCDVIAQDIAKAPLRLRRRTSTTTSQVVSPGEHPLAGMLALEPNRRHTWSEFTEMQAYWECFTSNSYAIVLRSRQNDPMELIPVQTGRVRELVSGRDVFYEITASTQQEQALLGASSLTVHERDMIHVRGRMLDGLDGYSTIVAGKKTIAAGRALENLRESIFAEDGQQRGVFWREGAGPEDVTTDIAFQRLRQQYKEMMSRYRRTVEPIVLEGGMKFQSIASNPKDIELAQQFSAQIVATCRLMRVPPHKVFEMDGEKYSNLETSEKIYVGDALVPRCKRREDRMAKVLLTPKERLEFFLEHDRDAMTLRDSQRENERIKTLVERGVIQIDEARAAMGYNALPNGQGKARLVPTNMSIIGEDGEVLLAGSSTAAPTDTPPADAPADTQPTDKPAKGLRVVK